MKRRYRRIRAWIVSRQRDATLHGILVWILISEAPVVVVIWISLLVFFGGAFTPSVDTCHYLYSSVFQGLAALVAVTLAVISLIYERLEKSVQVHLDDAKKSSLQLYRSDVDRLSYSELVSRTRNWYSDEIAPLVAQLSRSFAQYGTKYLWAVDKGALKGVPEINELLEDYQRLNSRMPLIESYSETASNLGRYRKSTDAFNRLPGTAVLGLAPSLIMMATSVILLGVTDFTGKLTTPLVITVMFGTILSVFYVSEIFRVMFSTLFGGGRIPGFKETELTDTTDLKELLGYAGSFLSWALDTPI